MKTWHIIKLDRGGHCVVHENARSWKEDIKDKSAHTFKAENYRKAWEHFEEWETEQRYEGQLTFI